MGDGAIPLPFGKGNYTLKSRKGGEMDKKTLYCNGIEIARTIRSVCNTSDEVSYLFEVINHNVLLAHYQPSLLQPPQAPDKTA